MSQYYRVVGQSAESSFQKSGAPQCAREAQICEGEVAEFLFARPVGELFAGKSTTNIVVTDDAQKFVESYFGANSALPVEFRT